MSTSLITTRVSKTDTRPIIQKYRNERKSAVSSRVGLRARVVMISRPHSAKPKSTYQECPTTPQAPPQSPNHSRAAVSCIEACSHYSVPCSRRQTGTPTQASVDSRSTAPMSPSLLTLYALYCKCHWPMFIALRRETGLGPGVGWSSSE